MASSINGRAGASVIDNISSRCLIVTILSQKKSANLSVIPLESHRMDSAFEAYDSIRSMVLNKTLGFDLFSLISEA